MKTEVAVPHSEYPDETKEYLEEKLQHLVKYYDRTVSIRAMLEQVHDDHRTEIVANVGRGVTLVVDAHEETIRAAMDEALGRMARSLTRHKDKITNGTRRKARKD